MKTLGPLKIVCSGGQSSGVWIFANYGLSVAALEHTWYTLIYYSILLKMKKIIMKCKYKLYNWKLTKK